MSRFNLAIDTVLEHEGGYVNDPDDPGGATNFGISLRYLRKAGELDGELIGDIDADGDVDIDDIRAMSREDAEHIYKVMWWDRHRYARIRDQALATKVFDLAVNMGARQAHRLLQRACRAAGRPLVEDGIIGRNTLAAVNGLDAEVLLAALRSEAAGFYRVLIARDPVRKKWETGWLRRAYS